MFFNNVFSRADAVEGWCVKYVCVKYLMPLTLEKPVFEMFYSRSIILINNIKTIINEKIYKQIYYSLLDDKFYFCSFGSNYSEAFFVRWLVAVRIYSGKWE